MKMTFRWYGEKDSIPLEYIKQIPNISGVVTAVYEVEVGEVWPEERFVRKSGAGNGSHRKCARA